MGELVIIRGLPGSGKSTLARQMVGYSHLEADMYHVIDGVYSWDADKVSEAHAWCRNTTFHALRLGHSVVVSNTFTQAWEMKPYFDMVDGLGCAVRVITCEGKWDNVHGVSADAIGRMAERWEPVEMVDYV